MAKQTEHLARRNMSTVTMPIVADAHTSETWRDYHTHRASRAMVAHTSCQTCDAVRPSYDVRCDAVDSSYDARPPSQFADSHIVELYDAGWKFRCPHDRSSKQPPCPRPSLPLSPAPSPPWPFPLASKPPSPPPSPLLPMPCRHHRCTVAVASTATHAAAVSIAGAVATAAVVSIVAIASVAAADSAATAP